MSRTIAIFLLLTACGGGASTADPAGSSGGEGAQQAPAAGTDLRGELEASARDLRARFGDAIEREDVVAMMDLLGVPASERREMDETERRQTIGIMRVMLRMMPELESMEHVRVLEDGDLAGWAGYQLEGTSLTVSLVRFQRTDAGWRLPRGRGLTHHQAVTVERDAREVLAQVEEVLARPALQLRAPPREDPPPDEEVESDSP